MEPGDVETTYADLKKSKKVLGYWPKVSLEKGLKAFVEWLASVPEGSLGTKKIVPADLSSIDIPT